MLKQTFLLIAITAQTVCAQTKSKITVTDLTRIKQVSGIELSPDGQQAVYILTTIEVNPDQKEEYDYKTHIYLTGLKPGDSKALTRGAESARQAVWSPDGKRIAFARTVKAKSQIFVMSLDGGEAWQLTNSSYGASNPLWSPDGKRIAFTSGVTMAQMLTDSLLNPAKNGPAWSLEKPGFRNNNFIKDDKNVKPNPDGSLAEIRAYLNKDVTDKKAKVINRLALQGESTTEPDLSFTHLYSVDVAEGATPKPLTRGYASFQAANWLPNGQGLLAVTDRDSLKHPDREQDNAIVFVSADASGRQTTVLAEAGKSYGSPEPSPDGKQLAFLASSSEGVNASQIGLASLNNTTVSNIQLVTFDRAAGNFVWSTVPAPAKGKKVVLGYAIYFTASSNGGIPLYRLDPATRQVTQLTGFERGITAFDVAGNNVVFANTEVANPFELYKVDFGLVVEMIVKAQKTKSFGSLWINFSKNKLTNHKRVGSA